MVKEIYEVRNDYTDDLNMTHIDVYFDEDDNSQGKTVAMVCLDTGKVIFLDNSYRKDMKVCEAIAELDLDFEQIHLQKHDTDFIAEALSSYHDCASLTLIHEKGLTELQKMNLKHIKDKSKEMIIKLLNHNKAQ